MISSIPIRTDGKPPVILCLGAHCDDIEIGCGGTMLRLARQCPEATVRWVVMCSNDIRRREASASAKQFLRNLPNGSVTFETFRDGFLPHSGGKVKDFFETLKKEESPDLILTHYRHDLHQDHRTVCDLTWNTWRNHLIWEYEIPKYDGDLGAPNLFVHLSETEVSEKTEILLEAFETQRAHHWFDADTFRGLLRLRGIESNAPGRFAEAFYGRKLAMGLFGDQTREPRDLRTP